MVASSILFPDGAVACAMRVTIACVLLVVLAGCGGVAGAPDGTATTAEPEGTTAAPTTESPEPTATATPVPTRRPMSFDSNTTVEVVGGEYDGNATRIFRRVARIVGADVRAPTLVIQTPNESDVAVVDDDRSPFRVSLGIVPAEPDSEANTGLSLGAYTSGENDTVYLYRGSNGDDVLLAHEFVHVIQGRMGWSEHVIDGLPTSDGNYTSDGIRTYRLLSEGGATYVEARYQERHTNPILNATQDQKYRYGSAEGALARLNIGRYHLGAEHVQRQVSTPRALGAVYEDPPISTEQVLHDTDDPIADLNVSVVTDTWHEHSRDRHGELFVRAVLREELNRSAAVDAAHGWGVDERVTYERGNETGTAWALRWDDADNATEFETALDRFLDGRSVREDGLRHATDRNATYRVLRPTDETVVLLLGDESFVENATVRATPGNVTVEAGN
jgi:hypothetical protein